MQQSLVWIEAEVRRRQLEREQKEGEVRARARARREERAARTSTMGCRRLRTTRRTPSEELAMARPLKTGISGKNLTILQLGVGTASENATAL
jgi:hypothetical protein